MHTGSVQPIDRSVKIFLRGRKYRVICRFVAVYQHLHQSPAGSVRESFNRIIRRGRERHLHGIGELLHDIRLRPPHLELYNLEKDLGEEDDLASSESKLAVQMKRKIDSWLQSVGAILHSPNPDFHPQ
jgi:hypothetical protein